MKYIVVVAADGEIDNLQGFVDLKKAKAMADEEASAFDIDYNPGSVVVFELNDKGAATEVYRPEISSSGDDVEEDEIE
jgi:hypothetical protein